ncbi:MAG TPA: multidrug efflux SMR transporter [Gammaproteobacteria bacterium]|nr:multidrug efflux SMR transporter [Gammaproteobacteria bacterium]
MSKFLTAICLLLAILLEVAGTTSMKLSHGFTEFGPSVMIFVFYFLSFLFLAFSLQRLDMGMAYAIWSGLGTLLLAIIGLVIFSEPLTFIKTISLFLIIVGVIGLRLA